MWNRFATALTFLTIIPLPRRHLHPTNSEILSQSFACFPAVGFVLGAFCWSLARLLASVMPPLLLAVLITSALALLTRGLHLDGLADFADAVGGGATPKRRLEIMKDSYLGSFGSVALILTLLAKVAALESLIAAKSWLPLLLVPIFSRLGMVLVAFKSSYARAEGGLGKPFLEHMSAYELLIASVLAVALSLPFSILMPAVYGALVGLCAVALRSWGRLLFGGITGDILGTTNELIEIILFITSACIAAH